MTKNILVTDAEGNVLGNTYPKRAKGLIKSGRAIEMGGHMIRLSFSVDTGALSFSKEENEMANIIDFKARSFKLVEGCQTNRGNRLVVTENDENVECFELGNDGAQTEIARRVTLEPDQDYVFRFAMRSRFLGSDAAECIVAVYFDEVGDGYTYPLDRDDRNRIKPLICKGTEAGLFRIFELPFNSGDSTACTIHFVIHDMMAWIFPAKEAEAYAALEDVDYDKWRQDEIHKLTKTLNDIGGTIGDTLNGIGGTLGKTLNGVGEFFGEVGGKISKAVGDVIRSARSDDDEDVSEEEAAAAGDEAEKDEAAAEEAESEAEEDETDEAVLEEPVEVADFSEDDDPEEEA